MDSETIFGKIPKQSSFANAFANALCFCCEPELLLRLWNCGSQLARLCDAVSSSSFRRTMSRCHPLLGIYVRLLRFLGLWNLGPNTAGIKSCVYLIYKCAILLMIFLFIGALTADLYLCNDDLLIVTDDGCILAGLSVILFKLMNFQIYPKKVERLLDFVDDNVRLLHEAGNVEHLKIWRRYIVREKVTIYSFGTIGISLIIVLMFFTPTKPGELPIRSEYYFDVSEWPFHQLMFIYQGVVLTVAMLSILAMDNIVISLCSQIFCHFEILKLNFAGCSTLVDRGNIQCEKNHPRIKKFHKFRENFLRCVRRHREIIDVVIDLNEFCSSSMFAQLVASNILICLTGFQAILVVGQSSGFIKFAIYLGAAFSQLFYWCWCGSELIHQSSSLVDVLWLCPWDLVDIKTAKSLITIPLMRAKKPLKLRAGKFYIMSMEAFVSVLRGSYSYFTLLNKMNEAGN